jgi:hypothetical protein
MRNWWIRFGCFIVGYNYNILKNCSEVAIKSLTRYTSAILIVSILWSFVGYSFASRYLHTDLTGSIAAAIVCVIIVIQIERQIILSMSPSKSLYLSRALIAFMMAIIGSVIIDQIIFKDDIELEKVNFVEKRIKKALPPRTEELTKQINQLDREIADKEKEVAQLNLDIEKKPTIVIFNTETATQSVTETTIDSITGKPTTKTTTKPTSLTTRTTVPNPNIERRELVQSLIKQLQQAKAEKEATLLNIRPQLEKEISSKVGFLDELEIMFEILSNSFVGLLVWLIWFVLLVGLELFVVASKRNEKENDYERTIKHHMALQIRKLEALARTMN